MIIKSSKDYHVLMLIEFMLVVGACILLLSIATDDTLPFIIISSLFLLILVIRGWVSVGRTLIMDKEGCTVRFLWISRKYTWTELKTKRVEDYPYRWGANQPYAAGAVFFSGRIRKPSWLMPADYSMLVHPFRFFFVVFDPHIQHKIWNYQRCPDTYLVDEAEFRQHMAEWNVELQE